VDTVRKNVTIDWAIRGQSLSAGAGEADFAEIWVSTGQAGEGDPDGSGAGKGAFGGMGGGMMLFGDYSSIGAEIFRHLQMTGPFGVRAYLRVNRLGRLLLLVRWIPIFQQNPLHQPAGARPVEAIFLPLGKEYV
jgi:hypothetical protein